MIGLKVDDGGTPWLTFNEDSGRIGFYCWNGKRAAGHIDVDWFSYQYDGPKGGL